MHPEIEAIASKKKKRKWFESLSQLSLAKNNNHNNNNKALVVKFLLNCLVFLYQIPLAIRRIIFTCLPHAHYVVVPKTHAVEFLPSLLGCSTEQHVLFCLVFSVLFHNPSINRSCCILMMQCLTANQSLIDLTSLSIQLEETEERRIR